MKLPDNFQALIKGNNNKFAAATKGQILDQDQDFIWDTPEEALKNIKI